MAKKLVADASPEKRLFISLLTRDIPLVAAFLDLIDNSVNAAVEPFAQQLSNAEAYLEVLQNDAIRPSVKIEVFAKDGEVKVQDNAGGISAEVAKSHVFKFGRASGETHRSDRLSVYGIGLKRAMFKLGNKIKITSDHVEGGFDLNLDVRKWEADTSPVWTFEITERAPVKANKCGTKIVISELYNDVSRRVNDGVFEGQLREAISKTYAFYMTKFVNIELNGTQVDVNNIEVGDNHTSDYVEADGVSCAITAGIGIPHSGTFRDRSSGWFVFCNGRAVVSADKSALTGWGTGSELPIFQPKHRPFLGTVFFVSTNPENLPWTTTKSGLNEDMAIWQEAKRHMIVVGKKVISFLDSRYTDEGTEVSTAELQEAAGKRVSVISAAVSQKRIFTPPSKPAPKNSRIQYDARVKDIKAIEEYLGRPGMGGAEVGRYTFNYFLENEVGD